MTDLTQAIEELRRVTPPNSPWEAGDIGAGSSPVDYHIATTLNAVLSGDLIPKADADLAVALMVEPLLKLREGIEADIRSAHHGRGNGSSSAMREDDRDFRAAVAAAFDALAPDAGTAALAELQALRDERDAAVANQFITRVERDGAEDHATETADELRQVRARAEAAEAELVTLRAQVERLTGALTIAANRLHRCSVDYDTGTREFIEVGGWADEARAALAEVRADARWEGVSPLTYETPAQHEERTCTCGAGHGSLEGHMDWCDFTAYQSLNALAEVQARDDASTPPADTPEGQGNG